MHLWSCWLGVWSYGTRSCPPLRVRSGKPSDQILMYLCVGLLLWVHLIIIVFVRPLAPRLSSDLFLVHTHVLGCDQLITGVVRFWCLTGLSLLAVLEPLNFQHVVTHELLFRAWDCASGGSDRTRGRGSCIWAQIFNHLKSIRGSKRFSRSLPMRRGIELSGNIYTSWIRLMGPTNRCSRATCSVCVPTDEYVWMSREHFLVYRVCFLLAMVACTWVKSSVDIRVNFAAVSSRAASCTVSSRVVVR